MIDRIADIIEEEIARFQDQGETTSEAIRWAAWLVMEELPEATAKDFGAAGEQLGRHRQSTMNRWNEAKKNWDAMYAPI